MGDRTPRHVIDALNRRREHYRPDEDSALPECGDDTVLIVPQGNANDASHFLGLCEESMARTGVIPNMVSADGGYASRSIRELLFKMGVKRVCISSSKGKAITPEADWTSHPYEETRRNRSAVESLMYQLKYLVRFGRAARRGLAAVTAELTNKILAFNFRRICYLTG
jgi:IS5 family transposase